MFYLTLEAALFALQNNDVRIVLIFQYVMKGTEGGGDLSRAASTFHGLFLNTNSKKFALAASKPNSKSNLLLAVKSTPPRTSSVYLSRIDHRNDQPKMERKSHLSKEISALSSSMNGSAPTKLKSGSSHNLLNDSLVNQLLSSAQSKRVVLLGTRKFDWQGFLDHCPFRSRWSKELLAILESDDMFDFVKGAVYYAR